MDAATLLGFIVGYIAATAGVFLLYSPVIALFVALLLAAGVLQLLLLPFIIVIRKMRRPQPEQHSDGGWILRR